VKRSRRIAAAATLIGLLVAILAPTAGAAESAFLQLGKESAAEKLASESTLRLTDLPAGFVLGGETACGLLRDPSENEGIYERREHLPPTPSEAFVNADRPGFCFAEYRRLYRAAGTGRTPLTLSSFALVAPSAKAASEGLTLGAELFEYTLGVGGFTAGGPAPAVGEEARLFRTNRVEFRDLFNLPGTLVLWRQGAVIAGVFATSTKEAVSDAVASAYAARQQTVVTAPRPYPATEAGDRATYLGNPNLSVPVYWLGPKFQLKGSPTSYFESAFGSEELGEQLPGQELSVRYSDGPFLDTWTPRGWERFSRTELGRRGWSQPCTHAESIKLPEGFAVIYASYRKDETTCPSTPPRHFSAHIFLPGAVIAIGEAPNRYSQGFGAGSFESWRGMKAIARALRRYRG
jgi:hypothetical protein